MIPASVVMLADYDEGDEDFAWDTIASATSELFEKFLKKNKIPNKFSGKDFEQVLNKYKALKFKVKKEEKSYILLNKGTIEVEIDFQKKNNKITSAETSASVQSKEFIEAVEELISNNSDTSDYYELIGFYFNKSGFK